VEALKDLVFHLPYYLQYILEKQATSPAHEPAIGCHEPVGAVLSPRFTAKRAMSKEERTMLSRRRPLVALELVAASP
jgi:hypothetical protein